MVSSSKPHHPSRRSRRTAAVITASLLTSSVSPVTAFAQDPGKDINTLIQGATGNLLQAPAMPGLPAASPPANGGNETKPADTAAAPSVTMPSSPNLADLVPTEVTKASQDVVDKFTQGEQTLGNTVKVPEETFEVEVEGEGVPDKAKVTITKKITDLTNGKVHLKGENWKTKDGKGRATVLVRLKGYDAQTGVETIFKQENPALQQSPADGKAADPEVYWEIKAEEDGTFDRTYDLPKNLTAGQGLKLAFETGAAANDIKRNKTTESLVIGGTEYVEKQMASASAAPRAMAAAAAPLQKQAQEKVAELTEKAAEGETAAKEAGESVKAEVQALGSPAANAVTPPAPGGSTEPTDSGKTTAPETPPSTSSTTPTTPSTTPGPSTPPSSTPPNNSGTSQKTTTPTQTPKETKKQQESSSSDTIKDINYLLKEIKNVDKAFENLLGAAALAALSSSGGSNIPGLPGNNNIPGLPGGLNNSTKTATPTTPRAGGQGGTTTGTKPGTGTSGNGTAGKATGGTAGGTKTTTQKGTSTNALSGLGSLSSLLGGTPGRGTSVGGTRTSGTTTGGTSRSNSGTGATRSTGGTGATRTTTGTNGASSATGARVVNPSTNGRAATGARAAGAAGSAKATTSNSASASSKPQPKHTPKPPVKTRDQLTQKNAHGVTGTLKNETLTMKIPRLKSGDWAYLYIYSADTSQKPVGIAWAQLDSTGSVKLDTKDLPDGEYTVAAVDEKDQLVGWVDMKLGEIKNAAFEGENDDKVVAAQAGVMSAADWWMIGASMLIPLLTASMIYAFRRPRRS